MTDRDTGGRGSRVAAGAPAQTRALLLANLLFWSILCYLGVSRFLVGTGEIVGASMYPALHNGDRFLINRLALRFRDPALGDVVALRIPGYDGLSVKRIVAMPNDVVQIRDGRLCVNGDVVTETYLPPDTPTGSGPMADHAYTIDPDCYFVLGDNRRLSVDSRYFGAVKRSWITGVIVDIPF